MSCFFLLYVALFSRNYVCKKTLVFLAASFYQMRNKRNLLCFFYKQLFLKNILTIYPLSNPIRSDPEFVIITG